MADLLHIRRVDTGEIKHIGAEVEDTETPAGEHLTARKVWLEGTPNRTELVIAGAAQIGVVEERRLAAAVPGCPPAVLPAGLGSPVRRRGRDR